MTQIMVHRTHMKGIVKFVNPKLKTKQFVVHSLLRLRCITSKISPLPSTEPTNIVESMNISATTAPELEQPGFETTFRSEQFNMSESAIFFSAAVSHVNKPWMEIQAFHLPRKASVLPASLLTEEIFIVRMETVYISCLFPQGLIRMNKIEAYFKRPFRRSLCRQMQITFNVQSDIRMLFLSVVARIPGHLSLTFDLIKPNEL